MLRDIPPKLAGEVFADSLLCGGELPGEGAELGVVVQGREFGGEGVELGFEDGEFGGEGGKLRRGGRVVSGELGEESGELGEEFRGVELWGWGAGGAALAVGLFAHVLLLLLLVEILRIRIVRAVHSLHDEFEGLETIWRAAARGREPEVVINGELHFVGAEAGLVVDEDFESRGGGGP